MPAQKKKRAKTKATVNRPRRRGKRYLLLFACIFTLLLAAYLAYLNYLINIRFEDDTWALPSRVYGRSLELYPGLELQRESLLYELDLASYKQVNSASRAGEYQLSGRTIKLHIRAFEFSDQSEPARLVEIEFSGSRIKRISDPVRGKPLSLLRLPPIVIGSYHPENGEDRQLLKYDEIPEPLIAILLAVEDKQYFNHFGINPFAIARALIANVRAGRTVQGGSTLTQQLAKNLFLTPEKSLLRKINEALMAMLLEVRFSKQVILTAYMNEVFLLQQKNIAIHGFQQASKMLFKQELDQLRLDQLALLVGMVKGPSSYNPLVNPESALKRRNLVLRIMREHKIIDKADYKRFIRQPLSSVDRLPGVNPFPAYLDLVKRQLNINYSSSELSARGLRIFTAFDPIVQRHLELGLKTSLSRFNVANLQSAVVIADYLNGDVLALVGDRDTSFPGFNRAVMAQRPIGSLIKPLLLYGLLERKTSLASLVKDKAIQIRQSDGNIWAPRNYDRKLHGEMTLYQAFIKSYNLPFVHLGVNGGLEALVDNLEKIKLLKHDTVYPSILLGTSPMSAFEVAQMYQVIANNGYFTPLTTIRQVSDKDNRVLNRIPLDSKKLFDKATMIQVQRAMVGVSEEGTAKYLTQRFGQITLAGKTGTTNDMRDSWFAGFSDRLLGVAWLGKDDNTPTQLTGSSGALRVWAEIMARQPVSAFKMTRDEALEWHYVDRINGRRTRQNCAQSVLLPFRAEQVPNARSHCK